MEINNKSQFSDEKNRYEDEIDIFEIFSVLWKGKIKIFFITAFISIGAIIYSLSLPNVYKSHAILASASGTGNDLSRLAGQYAGLASMAGVSIPSSGELDKVAMGIEVINSLGFFEDVLINNNKFFFKLLAPKDWNKENNILVINENLYDLNSKKWVSEGNYSFNGKPSIQAAHRDFHNKFSISEDPLTGFVNISFEHYSPYVAKEFLDILIFEINERTRSEDIAIAMDSIDYLQNEVNRTQLNSILEGINILIQKQIETIALANASPQYLFKILSEPYAPEIKSEPKRSIIVILFSLLGGMLGCILVLFQNYSRKA